MIRWGVIALMVAGSAAGVARADEDPDDALVVMAQRIAADQALFPAHDTEVLPGTFADHVAPLLPALHATVDRLREARGEADLQRVNQVIGGERPISALPPIWLQELTRSHDAVAGVLRASHARSALLPKDLRLFPFWGGGPATGIPLQQAIRLAVLDARAAAERGQGSEAAQLCLDAIAVARALGHGYLVPRLFSDGELPHLAQGCAFTVRSMDAPTLAHFQASLSGLLSTWTPLSWTFEQESVFGQLSGFAASLDDGLLARLPKAALALTKVPEDMKTVSDSSLSARVRQTLFGSWARRRYAQAMKRWCQIVDDPRANRTAVLAELDDSLSLPFKLLGDEQQVRNYAKFAQRDLDQRTALIGLLAVTYVARFHQVRGAWPSSLAEAGFPSRWVDLTTGQPLRIDPRAGQPAVVAGTLRLPLAK